MNLATKLRKNEKVAQALQDAQMQQSLRAMQDYHFEKITRTKKALLAFLEHVKDSITDQVEAGLETYQIGVPVEVEAYGLDTQDVIEELELYTVGYGSQKDNFFTYGIIDSAYVEEFSIIQNWAQSQGVELYWEFEEDRSIERDEYSCPRGTVTIRVRLFT